MTKPYKKKLLTLKQNYYCNGIIITKSSIVIITTSKHMPLMGYFLY